MSKQGVKICLFLIFFEMQKVTSSDQKYRSQRKEKMLFKSLSNTLMRKKFKKLVFGGLRDVKYFFWTNHFFLAFSSLIFLQFSMPKQGVKNCIFFKCQKWQVLIKNIGGKEKRKYYLHAWLFVQSKKRIILFSRDAVL